jgi:shikimate dehydrogenase
MKKFGLLGYPLEHSGSPEIYKGLFEDSKEDSNSYQLIPIKNQKELDDFFNSVSDFSGLNVTIPYKQIILKYIDRLSSEAEQTGAVNCIKINRSGRTYLEGYNTDYMAFKEVIEPVTRMRNFKALVLGTGGSSAAVCLALTELEIPFLKVSRKAREEAIAYSDLDEEIMNSHKLIINATPLGMFPNTETYPDIPYQFMEPGYVCFDLVYNPPKTKFLEKAEQQGAGIINGELMLYRQAVKSFGIWNSVPSEQVCR